MSQEETVPSEHASLKRHPKLLFIGLFLILVGLVIAMGSSFGLFRNDVVHDSSSVTKAAKELETPAYLPNPPSGGKDEYRCFILDPKLTKTSFLRSVAISPTNPHISHHGILYRLSSDGVGAAQDLDSQSKESGWSCFGDSGISGAGMGRLAPPASWISFWAPGGNFKQFPAGAGMKMNAGDQFVLQVHFHLMSGMSPESASMKVALKYASAHVDELHTMLLAAPIELPCNKSESGPLCRRANAIADLKKRTVDTALSTNNGLELKCGLDPRDPKPSDTSTCTQTVPVSANILGATGHMHKLGKSIVISLQDGVTGHVTTLFSQSVWDFDKQTTQWLKKPLTTKAGDVLKVTCTYDTKLRSRLPELTNEPPRYVVWGEGSNDEMCLAIINYVG